MNQLFLSPTAIAKYLRCPRKWAFRYIDGIKPQPTASMKAGIKGHKRIEQYLNGTEKTPGSDKLGKLICKAIRPAMLPQPDRRLMLEKKFVEGVSGAHGYYINLLGYIDCLRPAMDGNPITVIDHKFIGDYKYALTEETIRTDIQALIYSYFAIDDEDEPILNRWIYYNKNTDSVRKVECLRYPDEIVTDVLALVPTLREIAYLKSTCTKAMDATHSYDACSDYGGCPHVKTCEPNIFDMFWTEKEEETPMGMSVLDKLKAKQSKGKEDIQSAKEALEEVAEEKGGAVTGARERLLEMAGKKEKEEKKEPPVTPKKQACCQEAPPMDLVAQAADVVEKAAKALQVAADIILKQGQ